MPLLQEIDRDYKEYAEAQRLLNMLKYFKEIPNEYVPTNSLLKEFLGGGTFNLHWCVPNGQKCPRGTVPLGQRRKYVRK